MVAFWVTTARVSVRMGDRVRALVLAIVVGEVRFLGGLAMGSPL